MIVSPWIFLLAAIAVEVVGVTIMKSVADAGSVSSLMVMYAMIGLSFCFLALSVKRLPLALAYAIWETVGLICVAFIGVRYFGESLGTLKLLGIGVLIVGVVLVNIGAPHDSAEQGTDGGHCVEKASST